MQKTPSQAIKSKSPKKQIANLLSTTNTFAFLKKATRQTFCPRRSPKKQIANLLTKTTMPSSNLREAILQANNQLSERYDLLLEHYDNNETALLQAVQHLLPSNFFLVTNNGETKGEEKNSNGGINNGRISLIKQHPHTLDLILEHQNNTSTPSTTNTSQAMNVLSQAVYQLSKSTSETKSTDGTSSTTSIRSSSSVSRDSLLLQGVDPQFIDLILEAKRNATNSSSSTRTVSIPTSTSNVRPASISRESLLLQGVDPQFIDLVLEAKRNETKSSSSTRTDRNASESKTSNESKNSYNTNETEKKETLPTAESPSTSTFLNLTGKRELMTDDACNAIFSTYTPSKLNSIQHIIFGSKSFDRSTSSIASKYIEQMNNLIHADLADTIAGRETSIGLDVLKTFGNALMNCSKLESLDLSFNALGTRGINVLQPIIQRHNLKTLRFFDTGLAASACEEVLRCLELCKETNGHLELNELVFGESTSNSEGAIAIAKMLLLASQSIEIFQMSAIRCGTSQYMSNPLLGGDAVANALISCTNMLHLNISDNSFRGAHVDLAKAIATMKSLTILNIKDIILTDEGADCVLKALAQSKPPLEELLMGHNNLSPVGLRRLRQAATCLSSTLRVLDFCGAEDLENNGAVLIGRAIENICPKLETLEMSECFLTRRGVLAMIKIGLKGKTNMKTIGLDGNRISEEGIDEILMLLGSLGYPDGETLIGTMEENEDDEESDPEDELNEEYVFEQFEDEEVVEVVEDVVDVKEETKINSVVPAPVFTSWECSGCGSGCDADEMACLCCETLQPGRTQEEVNAAKAAKSGGGNSGITFGTQPTNTVTFGTQPSAPSAPWDSKSSTEGISFGAQPTSTVTFGAQPTNAVTFGTQPESSTKVDDSSNTITAMSSASEKLTHFYNKYAPEKIMKDSNFINKVGKKYIGKEKQLFQHLFKKYKLSASDQEIYWQMGPNNGKGFGPYSPSPKTSDSWQPKIGIASPVTTTIDPMSARIEARKNAGAAVAPGSSFSFGASQPAAAAPTTSSTTSSFSFGSTTPVPAVAPTASASTSSFSFGSTAPPAPTLAAAPTATSTNAFGFGNTPVPTPTLAPTATSTGGFGFGSPAATSAATPSSFGAMSFGGPSSMPLQNEQLSTWKCSGCEIDQAPSCTECFACGTLRPPTDEDQLGEQPVYSTTTPIVNVSSPTKEISKNVSDSNAVDSNAIPKMGEAWSCPGCMTTVEASNLSCLACGMTWWSCAGCMTMNPPQSDPCPSCQMQRPPGPDSPAYGITEQKTIATSNVSSPGKKNSTNSNSGFGFGFGGTSNTNSNDKNVWNCSGCGAGCSVDEMKCPCCETFQPGKTQADIIVVPNTLSQTTGGSFSFGQTPTAGSGSFSFGTPEPTTSVSTPVVSTPVVSTPVLPTSSGGGFSFGTPTTEPTEPPPPVPSLITPKQKDATTGGAITMQQLREKFIILGKEETKDMTVINQAVDLVINKLQQGVQDVLLSNNEMGKQFFNKIATKISKKIKKLLKVAQQNTTVIETKEETKQETKDTQEDTKKETKQMDTAAITTPAKHSLPTSVVSVQHKRREPDVLGPWMKDSMFHTTNSKTLASIKSDTLLLLTRWKKWNRTEKRHIVKTSVRLWGGYHKLLGDEASSNASTSGTPNRMKTNAASTSPFRTNGVQSLPRSNASPRVSSPFAKSKWKLAVTKVKASNRFQSKTYGVSYVENIRKNKSLKINKNDMDTMRELQMVLNTKKPHQIGALILETANRANDLLKLIEHDKWLSTLDMFLCKTDEELAWLFESNGRVKAKVEEDEAFEAEEKKKEEENKQLVKTRRSNKYK